MLLLRIAGATDEHELSRVRCEQLLDEYMAKHMSEWPVDGSNPSRWATISCSQHVSKTHVKLYNCAKVAQRCTRPVDRAPRSDIRKLISSDEAERSGVCVRARERRADDSTFADDGYVCVPQAM